MVAETVSLLILNNMIKNKNHFNFQVFYKHYNAQQCGAASRGQKIKTVMHYNGNKKNSFLAESINKGCNPATNQYAKTLFPGLLLAFALLLFTRLSTLLVVVWDR
jgi:hypothetical protein